MHTGYTTKKKRERKKTTAGQLMLCQHHFKKLGRFWKREKSRFCIKRNNLYKPTCRWHIFKRRIGLWSYKVHCSVACCCGSSQGHLLVQYICLAIYSKPFMVLGVQVLQTQTQNANAKWITTVSFMRMRMGDEDEDVGEDYNFNYNYQAIELLDTSWDTNTRY